MNQITLCWELYEEGIENVERYCSSCGKKVIFYDSMVRRHNANGKKIYKYAIYKCEKGHTWNKLINKYFSKESKTLSSPGSLENNRYIKEDRYKNPGVKRIKINSFSVSEYIKQNIDRIDIFIMNENCSIRLDKLLNENLLDMSRTQIQQKIKDKVILVNDRQIKPKYIVKHGDKITIFTGIKI